MLHMKHYTIPYIVHLLREHTKNIGMIRKD